MVIPGQSPPIAHSALVIGSSPAQFAQIGGKARGDFTGGKVIGVKFAVFFTIW